MGFLDRSGPPRLLDGAIGTWLAAQDESLGTAPHLASLKKPELVAGLCGRYVEAGAQALQANAWLALHLGEAEAERVVRAACHCLAPAANAHGTYRLLSLAPGPGSPPSGKVAFFDHLEQFDAVVVETLIDPWQLAWVSWLAEWSPVPVAASLVPDSRPGTWEPGDFATRARKAGARAVGLNCGYADTPNATAIGVAQMRQAVPGLPILARPALWEPDLWLSEVLGCVEAGADWVGGCCGSGPEDIQRLQKAIRSRN